MYKNKIISNGFPPEFINRIDGFLLFPSLDHDQLYKICDIQLNEIQTYFTKIKINLDKDSIIEYMIDNVNSKEGGRSSKKMIKNIILPSIMDKILDNRDIKEINFTKSFATF
jgi:ATP-dependent Clp protease ATP-binding subunit ClpB